jgi:hypothetical protein
MSDIKQTIVTAINPKQGLSIASLKDDAKSIALQAIIDSANTIVTNSLKIIE